MSPPVTINTTPACVVRLAFEYQEEFDALPKAVKTELLAQMKLLRLQGHRLTRPDADKLRYRKNGVLPDPRELIVKVNREPWRFLYVFYKDTAVLLAGGCKAGVPEDDFYARLFRDGERVFGPYKARVDAEAPKGDKRGK